MNCPGTTRISAWIWLLTTIALLVANASSAAESQQGQAARLVAEMIANENARDLEAQMGLYGKEFTYAGKRVSQTENRKNTAAYYKRWPQARWQLLRPVEITGQISPELYEAIYEARFRVESPQRGKWSEGTIRSRLTISNSPKGPLIVAANDEISDASKGDLQVGEDMSKQTARPLASNPVANVSLADPVPILQRERVTTPTFATVDSESLRLAYGNMQNWQVLDLASRKVIAFGSAPKAASPYFGVCFSPNGDVLALVQGGNRSDPWIELVPLDSPHSRTLLHSGENKKVGTNSVTFDAHDGAIQEVVFAAGGTKRVVPVNDSLSHRERGMLPTFASGMTKSTMAWIRDGSYFISLIGGVVRVTDVSSWQTIVAAAADNFQLSSDRGAILFSASGKATIYDVATGQRLWTGDTPNQPFAFSKGGSLLSFTPNGRLTVQDLSGKAARAEEIDAGGISGAGQSGEESRLVVDPQGRMAIIGPGPAQLMEGRVSTIDITERKIAWSVADGNPKAPFVFSGNGKLLALARYCGFGSACADVYSVMAGEKVHSIEFDTPSYGMRALNLQPDVVYAAADDSQGVGVIELASNDSEKSLTPTHFFGPSERVDEITVSPDGKHLITSDAEGFVNVWSLKLGKLSFRIAPDLSGGPVFFLPSGEYAGDAAVFRQLGFRQSSRAYPFEQFDLRLNRPDIVLERLGAPDEAVDIARQLREKRLKRMGVTDEMLKPDFHLPEIEIVGDIPSATDADEINLSIKASDSKYPLERAKVFVNNVPVNGRDGESLRDQNSQTLERTIPIKLAAGRNKIQVSVLNNAGAESLYANAEVNCTAKRPKPTLYAVALGVSEYSNSDWNLKYAAKDARDVLARLKDKAEDQYGDVKELLLTDKDVTKENLAKVREFLKGATIDDTVLMFAAGHGLLDSKYDYYFGTTDIDFNNPSDEGIAFEEFDDLLADLPSLKKALLIDTCHAGELDEEEKTLLASAGGVSAPLPAGNGIALRSIGTRGMNVKAIEGARGASEWYDRLQGLFVDLRRGSGSTILSSSAGAEYALESSEQQNGLFTYAVLEALDGKKRADTDKDGFIEMSELGEYVKKRVAELTNNKQTPNTRRVNLEGDFTLAKTK